jgi:hypothetical protein
LHVQVFWTTRGLTHGIKCPHRINEVQRSGNLISTRWGVRAQLNAGIFLDVCYLLPFAWDERGLHMKSNDWNSDLMTVEKARFIAAALSLDVPLTNKLSEYMSGELLSLFPDLTAEREIIQKGRV